MLSGTSADVAIAVVSWNTRDPLNKCLRSLKPEVDAGRAEVWVVDNASSDGSAELVRSQHPWVMLIESDQNLGFGPAVNLVARRTATEWIAPANADIKLRAGTLQTLIATATELPKAGIIAPRLIGGDGETQRSAYAFPTLPFTLLFNLGIASANDPRSHSPRIHSTLKADRPARIDWALGAFMLVRRAAWDAAGGFDPEQWMHAEDLDLAWRVARAGWRAYYEPRAVVEHLDGAATSKMWGDAVQAERVRSTYAWMLSRRGIARTRAAALMNVGGASAKALALTPAARIAPGRWAWRRGWFKSWARLHAVGLAPKSRLERPR